VVLDTHSHSAFRSHARAWLTLVPPGQPGTARPIQLAEHKALLADHALCRDGTSIDSVVLARGDFHTGTGCQFRRPVFVSGNCHVGKGCQLDAISVEGDLILGPGSVVARWAEAGRILDLRPGSVVQQAALAGQAIQVGIDSWAGSLTAPEITTTGRMTDFHELADPRNSIEIAPPSRGELPELGCVRGFKLEKLIPLGAETWVYDGSLALPVPVYLHSKLVVRGSFQCPAGSLLGDDVKTGDTMRIGAGSICKGNLTARAELILERDCVFEAELRGDRTVRLSQGVRGVNPSGLVRAEARQDLILEPNVVVRGQLAAAGRVVGAEPAIEGGLELLLAEG